MATNEHDERNERDERDQRNEWNGNDADAAPADPGTVPADPGTDPAASSTVPADEDRIVRESQMYDPAVDQDVAATDPAPVSDATAAPSTVRAGEPASDVPGDDRVVADRAASNRAAEEREAADRATADHAVADRTGDDRVDESRSGDDHTSAVAPTAAAAAAGSAARPTDGDLTAEERASIREERGTTTATPTRTTTEHTVDDEERRSIQVQAPTTPVKRSNRGFGIGVMLLSSLIFAAVYGALLYLVTFFFLDAQLDGGLDGVVQALGSPVFWVPVVVYLVACILWVLIVNRAGGWLHVLFGLIVGVLAYASVVAVVSVTASLAESRPEDIWDYVFRSLIDVRALLAFIVARELPIWFGAWVGRRGRKLREQHAEARRVYDDEVAAQGDRSRVG